MIEKLSGKKAEEHKNITELLNKRAELILELNELEKKVSQPHHKETRKDIEDKIKQIEHSIIIIRGKNINH